MMKSIIYSVATLFGLIAVSSGLCQVKCDKPNYTIQGVFSNSSSTKPILGEVNTQQVKIGDKGELSKYFEETFLGMQTSGWIIIGTAEVTAISNQMITFKVLEKSSVVTVNGVEKSHFIAGKTIKFASYLYNVETAQTNYWDDGKTLLSTGTIICDKKAGSWKYYHPNGMLFREGGYDSNGLETGLWKYYNQQGVLIKEINLEQEEKNGVCKFYSEDGTISKVCTYKYDVEDGKYSIYYPNGKLRESGNMKFGLLDGLILNYFESGSLKYERMFKQDKKNGLTKTYYESGELEQSGNYVNSKEEGNWKAFNKNGQLIFDVNYTNGELNGPGKEFYDNGNLKAEFVKKNGYTHGTVKKYYENGQLQSEENTNMGVIIGTTKTYYSNGQIQEIQNRSNDGKLNGEFLSYYEDGKPKSKGSYTEDTKSGKWFEWNEKGKKQVIKY
jgi:antitoxin component YwqK of YwqJK toxin-antitoxin module